MVVPELGMRTLEDGRATREGVPVPDGDVTNHVGVALADASGQGQAAFTNLVVEQLSDER